MATPRKHHRSATQDADIIGMPCPKSDEIVETGSEHQREVGKKMLAFCCVGGAPRGPCS